jgi:hypothetical protein
MWDYLLEVACDWVVNFVRRPLFGLLHQPRIIADDECGAVGGVSGRRNGSTRRKRAPLSLCPPQIPHDLGSNPGHCGEEPATNQFSHGTASMWDLWWTKWHWGRFSPSTSALPATHSTECSTHIIIIIHHHLGLVHYAK